MAIDDRMELVREEVLRNCHPLSGPWPSYCLFFSVSDGTERAIVAHSKGSNFAAVWKHGVEAITRRMNKRGVCGNWLRVDWVDDVIEKSPEAFEALLRKTKRNYFRKGLCFDRELARPLTEQEINANAILYGGPSIAHATLNAGNLATYGKARFGRGLSYDEKSIFLLSTRGVFSDETGIYPLYGEGLSRGLRQIESLSADDVLGLIQRGSEFLSRQVNPAGRFTYGYFPCFDRQIDTYNTLRHASTTYAMLEVWALTADPLLKAAIDRSLDYITKEFVKSGAAADGADFAMLVDTGGEIKLGGNAVLVLALVKYCEVTGTRNYLPLAESLARGIRVMQSQDTGEFVHILNASDFSVKEKSRIIYYEGEAAFALMRLYALTHEEQWLEMVEKAFSHFIAAEYWRKHDHWLSYCVNELTRYRSEEKYFRFGVRNFAGYLGFVANRITTFPTLLELMMAAHDMLSRLTLKPEFANLLDDVDLGKFYEALEKRAHHLLNGHFWPEQAMYFRKPDRILGSFFIRHQAFRVRIDDVEHYLSGLIAYLHYVKAGRPRPSTHKAGSGTIERTAVELAFFPVMAGKVSTSEPDGETAPMTMPDQGIRCGQTQMPIRVGMLRAGSKPNTTALAAAHAAAMQGAELFFFTPADVDINNRTINSLTYSNGAWVRTSTGFPDVIENDEKSREATEIWDALSGELPITTPQLGGKLKVMKRMEGARLYSELQIPTALITHFGDFFEFLLRHRQIVTKPVRGAQGNDVSFFSCEESGYLANIEGAVHSLERDGLREFYDSTIRGRNYLAQKYIESKTLTGLPFDIRLHVRRNRLAQWETVKIYARIGAGRTITSNLSAGGSIAAAPTFLRGQFGDQAGVLMAELRKMAHDFPSSFQGLYDDRILDALGIDIGIDRKGKLWIFEVNSYPGAEYFEMDDAIPRIGYAIYLAQQFRTPKRARPSGQTVSAGGTTSD